MDVRVVNSSTMALSAANAADEGLECEVVERAGVATAGLVNESDGVVGEQPVVVAGEGREVAAGLGLAHWRHRGRPVACLRRRVRHSARSPNAGWAVSRRRTTARATRSPAAASPAGALLPRCRPGCCRGANRPVGNKKNKEALLGGGPQRQVAQ